MFNITHALDVINNQLPSEELLRISEVLETIYEHEWRQLVNALLENRLEEEQRWVKTDQVLTLAGTARATIFNELQSLKEEGYIEVRKESSTWFGCLIAKAIATYLPLVESKSAKEFYQAMLNLLQYKDFEECRINHETLRQAVIYSRVVRTEPMHRKDIFKEQRHAELSAYV